MVHANCVQKTPAPCVHFALCVQTQNNKRKPSIAPFTSSICTRSSNHRRSLTHHLAQLFSRHLFFSFPLPSLSPHFRIHSPSVSQQQREKNQAGSRYIVISLQSPRPPLNFSIIRLLHFFWHFPPHWAVRNGPACMQLVPWTQKYVTFWRETPYQQLLSPRRGILQLVTALTLTRCSPLFFFLRWPIKT